MKHLHRRNLLLLCFFAIIPIALFLFQKPIDIKTEALVSEEELTGTHSLIFYEPTLFIRELQLLTKEEDNKLVGGLFQITGSDNEDFLKSLGATSISNLTIVGVLAIVDPAGFRKDTSLSMRVYKNVSKDGKPIITNGVVKVALDANVIAKEIPE
jgi:hypothetical protein